MIWKGYLFACHVYTACKRNAHVKNGSEVFAETAIHGRTVMWRIAYVDTRVKASVRLQRCSAVADVCCHLVAALVAFLQIFRQCPIKDCAYASGQVRFD